MSDRIIVRARPAGTRRLSALPTPVVGDGGDGRTATAAPTGLNAFLAAAQRQGAELVATAREQADDIAEAARAEGYRRGYEEGRARAEQELRDLFSFAESAVREVVEARSRLLAESEADVVRLAIAVAERVLVTEIALRPEHVVDVLRGALRKVFVRDSLQVICNPADLALIEAAGEDLSAQVGTLRNVELIADRRLRRGGVVVRTAAGDVDATLDAQLDRLREAMLGAQDG